MDGNRALYFDQSRLVDEWFGLRIYGVRGVRIIDCCNRLRFLGLSSVVELDVAFEDRYTLVRGLLLQLLLLFLDLFLTRRRDHAPTASPRCARSEPHSCPIFILNSGPIHDDLDVVEELPLASNQRASVCFLECRILVHS